MDENRQWEYRVQSLGGALRSPKDEELSEILNEWGLEGWELVTVVTTASGNQHRLIARRPLRRSSRRERNWPT